LSFQVTRDPSLGVQLAATMLHRQLQPLACTACTTRLPVPDLDTFVLAPTQRTRMLLPVVESFAQGRNLDVV
jgi:hypothetical protein